jgi:hypothetical protein
MCPVSCRFGDDQSVFKASITEAQTFSFPLPISAADRLLSLGENQSLKRFYPHKQLLPSGSRSRPAFFIVSQCQPETSIQELCQTAIRRAHLEIRLVGKNSDQAERNTDVGLAR